MLANSMTMWGARVTELTHPLSASNLSYLSYIHKLKQGKESKDTCRSRRRTI